jgi:predicted DCC family thiol-disulfide oxidoreductase YuxK
VSGHNSAILVYDGDCGFCSRSVNWLRAVLPAFPRAEPWQAVDLAALGLSRAEVDDAVQWVGPDGYRAAGPRALAALLRHQPHAGLRLLGRVGDARTVRPVVAAAYRWVAAHRHRLPGGTPACAVRPASPQAGGVSPPTAEEPPGRRAAEVTVRSRSD